MLVETRVPAHQSASSGTAHKTEILTTGNIDKHSQTVAHRQAQPVMLHSINASQTMAQGRAHPTLLLKYVNTGCTSIKDPNAWFPHNGQKMHDLRFTKPPRNQLLKNILSDLTDKYFLASHQMSVRSNLDSLSNLTTTSRKRQTL